jgi:hypothetical protein
MLSQIGCLTLTICLGTGPADEAGQEAVLPPPREAPAGPRYILDYPPPPEPPPRFGSRSVWQMFAPDRSGRFVPRVIYSPYGAYYQYNGMDFPWVTTQPLLYMPYIVD